MDIRMIRLSLLLLCVTITEQKLYQCDSNAPCGCSLNSASINARIVDGETAAANTWSWATSLEIGEYLCGGAVISDSYIMTAGHCMEDQTASDITAYFGSTSMFEGETRRVSRVYVHPQFYDPPGHHVLHDIALLKLSTPLNMADRTLAKVCLPKSNVAVPDDTDVIAIGWGRTTQSGSISKTLQQVTLNVINSTADWCTVIAANTTIQLCAGIMPMGGKGEFNLLYSKQFPLLFIGPCNGDSGGPLMAFNKDNLWEVQGIVSYGTGCAAPFRAGVYTRVSYYLDWINEIMKNDPGPSLTTTTTGIPTTTTTGMTTTSTTVNMLSKITSNRLIVLLSCFFAFISFK
jgi:secreted trypsin-like serine protease